MDKKRVGAIVGVAGVAGVIAASQFINIDASNADYVTKNLEAQYKESLKVMEKANLPKEDKKSEQKANAAQKVYDPVQKVEYRISNPNQVAQSADEEDVQKSERLPEKKERQPENKEISNRLSFIEVKPSSESQKEEDKENKGTGVPTEKEIAENIPKDQNDQMPTFSRETSKPFVGVVVTDVLNVRQKPTLDADVVTVALRNEVVRGSIDGDWIAVESSGALVGYVNRHFVQPVTEEEAEAQEEENRIAEEKKAEEERIAAEKAKKEAEDQAAAEKEAQDKREAEEKEQDAKASVSGYVNCDVINVRQKADLKSAVIGTLYANSAIEGTREGDWIRFDFHGSTGYVYAGLIGSAKIDVSPENTPKSAEKARQEEEAKKPKARAGYVNVVSNVRRGPGTNYEIITTFGVNRYVEGVESDGWVKFDYDGQEAYISSVLLSDEKIAVQEPSQPSGSQDAPSGSYSSIAEFARAQVGKPYVFACSGPDAFDCSGLVLRAYSNIGIYLPHSAESQSGYGYAVSMDNLQPGDMLFYTTDGSGTVSHVGIYVGDGMMVHASAPGIGVIMTNIYDNWYQSRFMGARRLVN
ncbi:NlpC/P60 family protein [uncultured Murdochiella sp.]|uniref:NlpC/P60 family protein n=1 Tax=uncultured Murdochiella sp. TaxID=1586095 RepID=UPI0028053213|nr:NlpC/P60 family protein [uncultured Murdochiella sp.]